MVRLKDRVASAYLSQGLHLEEVVSSDVLNTLNELLRGLCVVDMHEKVRKKGFGP